MVVVVVIDCPSTLLLLLLPLRRQVVVFPFPRLVPCFLLALLLFVVDVDAVILVFAVVVVVGCDRFL